MVTIARAPIAVAPNVSLSQSGLMVAALLGGFVVFLALQGKLGNYWSILLGGGASATTGATTGGAATTAAPTATATSPNTSTTATSATTPALAGPQSTVFGTLTPAGSAAAAAAGAGIGHM
jgi:hypothetical protein